MTNIQCLPAILPANYPVARLTTQCRTSDPVNPFEISARRLLRADDKGFLVDLTV
jgi:hypothetical protein